MLTKERIESNKKEFIDLINSINRDFDKDKLINYLENESDFFTAPASTKYHGNYEGGLCEHSLNVYYSLKNLNCNYMPKLIKNSEEDIDRTKYDEDNLKIVGLLHDISKANFFELYNRNIKDSNGNWQQVKEYKIRDNRFIFGSDEQTADFIISTFVPLTIDEHIAILHKTGGRAFDSTQTSIPAIFQKCELAVLLNCADLLSCYILEKNA